MEPEGQRLQDLSLSWAKPLNSNPHPPFHFLKTRSSFYVRVFQVVLSPQDSPQNTPMHLFSPPYMLHALPISFSIWSPE